MVTINTIVSLTFLSTTHPIPMIMSLITFTISSSMLSCKMFSNAWFGYSLTLIMIGGMMIIFIYMTATSPNTKIYLSSSIPMLLSLTTIFMPSLHSTPQKLSNNPMLEFYTSSSTIILASYLLITLSVINKSSMHLDSSMRSMN